MWFTTGVLKKTLIACLIVLILALPSLGKSEIRDWAMRGPPESFHLGVYLGSHGADIPLEKMFRDFAERSIDLIWINRYCFDKFQPKGLLSYAKDYGIYFVVQCSVSQNMDLDKKKTRIADEESLRQRVRDLKKMLDKDSAGKMVIGYSMSDEIEATWNKSKVPDAESIFRRYSEIIRSVDPNRLVTVNHAAGNAELCPKFWWYKSGEDWPWCSISVVLNANRSYAERVKLLAEQLGFRNYILAGQAEGVSFSQNSLKYWGFPKDASVKDYSHLSAADQIRETIINAYHLGISGVVFFVYDSTGCNYDKYCFVDNQGNDKEGKWQAFLDGARAVRNLQGWPEITELKVKDHEIYVFSSGQWGGHRVRQIEIEASNDNGKTWRVLHKIAGRDGSCELPDNFKGLLRVRAWDKHNYAMWRFIEVNK